MGKTRRYGWKFEISMYRALVFLLAVFLMAACKRLPNYQGAGETALQGIWQQDSVSQNSKLIKHITYGFKFTCDSFYVALTTRSKVNYYADSCFNKGVWQEYATGTYLMHKDTLILQGKYTKKDYKLKVQGCYNIGSFVQNFLVKKATKDTLVVENLADRITSELVLKESIVCKPKKL